MGHDAHKTKQANRLDFLVVDSLYTLVLRVSSPNFTEESNGLLLRLALGLRAGELVGLGEQLGQRGDEVGLLRHGGVLVGHAQAASSVVVPLASESEDDGADLGANALDLLEDALFSLTIRRDAIDEGGEVVGRVALAEIGLRSVFGDVEEFGLDEIAEGVRDALGLGRGAVFVLDLRNVLGRDLSESFAALDVVLQMTHAQDRSLKAHNTLGRLRGLADMTLMGLKGRVSIRVRREDASGKGRDEFEVLSAHFVLCFVCVGCFVGMFEVLRCTSEHFAQSPTGPAKRVKLLRCQDLFGVARFLRGLFRSFSLRAISNRESLLLRLTAFDLRTEILLKGFFTGRFNERHK